MTVTVAGKVAEAGLLEEQYAALSVQIEHTRGLVAERERELAALEAQLAELRAEVQAKGQQLELEREAAGQGTEQEAEGSVAKKRKRTPVVIPRDPIPEPGGSQGMEGVE